MGRELFFKIFPLCKCYYVNCWQEFQLGAQSMTDNIYNKRGPTRLYYGSRVKLKVFMALTNCFRKIIWASSFLLLFVKLFVAQWLSVPNKDPVSGLGGVNEPRQLVISVVI